MNDTQKITINSLSNKVEKEFQRFEIAEGTKTFKEITTEWLGENPKILSFKIDNNNDNIIVVVEVEEGNSHPYVTCKYNVYRFFPINTNWNVSQDLQFGTTEELVNKLLGVSEEDF